MIHTEVERENLSYGDGVYLFLLKELGLKRKEREKWVQVGVFAYDRGWVVIIQKNNPGEKDNNQLSFLYANREENGVFLYNETEEIDKEIRKRIINNLPPFIASLECQESKNEISTSLRNDILKKLLKQTKLESHPLLRESEYDRVDDPTSVGEEVAWGDEIDDEEGEGEGDEEGDEEGEEGDGRDGR